MTLQESINQRIANAESMANSAKKQNQREKLRLWKAVKHELQLAIKHANLTWEIANHE